MTTMPPLALLTGGLATRLRPLTEKIPKALIEVAGEPFIAHQLRLIRREGIKHVVLCVGYRAAMIEAFVGDGSRFGLEVTYSADGPNLLGTGGALRRALSVAGPEMLVMYGDSWLDTNYVPIVEAFRNSHKPALMTVYRNNGRWDRSNVWFEDHRIRVYDKHKQLPEMQHIDWGLGLLLEDALTNQVQKQAIDLSDVYTALAQKGQLAGYEVATRFYEIGSPAGLKETDALLRAQSR